MRKLIILFLFSLVLIILWWCFKKWDIKKPEPVSSTSSDENISLSWLDVESGDIKEVLDLIWMILDSEEK